MPTAAQVLASCNRVLLHLEQETLSATADLAAPATIEERLFAAHYDACAKRVIASHNWHCVRTREELTMSAVGSSSLYADDDWTYSGTLPGKLVALWGVALDKNWGPWAVGDNGDYLIESRVLYTTTSDVRVLFTWYPRAADYGDGTAYNATFNTAMGSYLDGLMPSLRDWIELEIAFALEPVLVKNENKRAEIWAAIHGDHRTLGAKAMARGQNHREAPRPNPNSTDLLNIGLGRMNPL